MTYNWGQKTRELYPFSDWIKTEDVEAALNACISSYSTERCNGCYFHRNGCSDRLGVVLQDKLKKLPDNEEAEETSRNFDVCFSDGTPTRCRKCSYSDDNGCWIALYQKALSLIKEAEAKDLEE